MVVHGEARQGVARQCRVSQGGARLSMAVLGRAGRGSAWQSNAIQSKGSICERQLQ